MGKIKPDALISGFWRAVNDHWGYIYGMKYVVWTAAKQTDYAKRYAGDPDRANSIKYGSKWIGHIVTDCSGLFAKMCEELGATVAHGSNSIWNRYLSDKGTLSGGKRTDGKELIPGTAVFTTTGEKHNHIGLYVGGGLVIEAQGAEAGCVTSLITKKKWTAWGELKCVDYSAASTSNSATSSARGGGSMPEGKLTVNANKVALRSGPNKSANVLTRADVGDIVTPAPDDPTWIRVTLKGKTGYMMRKFINEG